MTRPFVTDTRAPVFVPVPEEEEDEETGEIENQAEIDAAKEENRRLGSLWLNIFASAPPGHPEIFPVFIFTGLCRK